MAVLEGQFGPGDTIVAGREGDHIGFQREATPAPAGRSA
jgi:hypothetical protein